MLGGDEVATANAIDALADRLEPIVRDAAWSALRSLYPEADMAGEPPENAAAPARYMP